MLRRDKISLDMSRCVVPRYALVRHAKVEHLRNLCHHFPVARFAKQSLTMFYQVKPRVPCYGLPRLQQHT